MGQFSAQINIQRVLRDHIEVISPDLMVLAEEFGDWEDSRRRIDLLCLNRKRELVVVELKRTDDGGHMDLQALRYAAMVSPMTLDQAITAHQAYRRARNQDESIAEQKILEFLDLERQSAALADKVCIVLISADFSREITTAVLWLNSQGIDITCIRARPHSFQGHVILDIQQVIPLPESADYQVAIREKHIEKEVAETRGRDLTRYNVRLAAGKFFPNLPKRRMIYLLVSEAVRLGITPEKLRETIWWRKSGLFIISDGYLSSEELLAAAPSKVPERFYCDDDELFHVDGKTYALTNQWGNRALEAVELVLAQLPEGHGFSYEALF